MPDLAKPMNIPENLGGGGGEIMVYTSLCSLNK